MDYTPGRSPHGERGLKYILLRTTHLRKMGRSPHGERGLKLIGCILDVTAAAYNRVSDMEMGDVGTQRADDKLAGFIGGREVAQVHQKAEIIVAHAHICGEPGRIWGRSDKRGLIHVEVKYLKLYVHVLGGGVVADIAGGLEQLRVGDVLRLLLPLAGKEGNAAGAQELCLIHRFHQRGFSLFPLLLINRIGIELGAQQPGLCTVAYLQMTLCQDLSGRLVGLRIPIALDLNRVEKVIAGDGKERFCRVPAWKAHPLDCSTWKYF